VNIPTSTGRVVSLHLHSAESGAALKSVEEIQVMADKGILGEPRYFERLSRHSGKPSRRQLSLIEREQIAEHAATLGLETIPPGIVRSNIETLGINLVGLIGKEVRIGEAVVRFYQPRTPCAQMDAICSGLRELMKNSRQGVMAEVVKSGRIRVGDTVAALS
jgi:MOSC domain-containing protein YiiM